MPDNPFRRARCHTVFHLHPQHKQAWFNLVNVVTSLVSIPDASGKKFSDSVAAFKPLNRESHRGVWAGENWQEEAANGKAEGCCDAQGSSKTVRNMIITRCICMLRLYESQGEN